MIKYTIHTHNIIRPGAESDFHLQKIKQLRNTAMNYGKSYVKSTTVFLQHADWI